MAVTLSVQSIAVAGLVASYTSDLSAVEQYSFANNGRTFLHVRCPGDTYWALTFATPGNVQGLEIEDQVVTFSPGPTEVFVGPFSTVYNTAQGMVAFKIINPTGLSLAVLTA